MNTTFLLRWICLLATGWCFQASALVVNGGDAGHTTRPVDDPGWSNVGSVRGRYLDTNGIWRVSSSRAGVVYLGDDWFLTTYHAWWYDNPTGVVVNAVGYTVITNSLVRLTNPEPDMQINADIVLFRVTQKPDLPPLNITTLAPGGLWLQVLLGNRTVIMMGNGNPRTNQLSYWDAGWTNTTPANAVYTGYKFWGGTATNVLRWGSNQIDLLSGAIVNFHLTMPLHFGDVWAFRTTFNTNAGPDECQIAPIDSGGGVFYKNNGYWELTGVMANMEQPDGTDPKIVWGIANGGVSYIADLTYYRSQIMNTIKPGGWPDLRIVDSSAVTYPVHPGASFSIPIVTKNQGAVPATNFVTALYQVPETNTAAGIVVGQADIAALAAGQSVTNSYAFTAPVVPGLYYLIARADDGTNVYGTADGTVYESYENNNQSTYNARLLQVMPLYTLTTNNATLTITGYTGPGGAVTVPQTINGLPVAGIGTNAFAYRTNLTSIILPDSLKTIGAQAFQSCTNLTRIIIPNTVTNIGVRAFANCTSLTSLYFKGNAPAIVQPLFENVNGTVYYLPGSAGWPGGTNLWAGLSVAVWRPVISTGAPAFGIKTNQFEFCYTWTSGRVVIVEACTNLTGSSWVPLQTNTLHSDEPVGFSDPNFTNHPDQFYRIRAVF